MRNIKNYCNTEIAKLRHDHWTKNADWDRGVRNKQVDKKTQVNCKRIKNKCEDKFFVHLALSIDKYRYSLILCGLLDNLSLILQNGV